MNRVPRLALSLALCSLAGAATAQAQATRTWVSGVGDDVNPCSRTAPCKTFAGAISKTAAGGEISVLDSGAYGAVTITKSMTISGDGSLAGVLASGTNGITINDSATPPTVVVTLRNLSLAGVGPRNPSTSAVITDITGIRMLNGAALVVDRVSINGFVNGIETTVGHAVVLNSTITRNSGYGVHALGGSITIENSSLINNGVAVQSEAGAAVRLSNNGVYNNLTGFGCGGGTLASAGNNRKANNVGGIVAACAPNATITVQ